MSPSGSINTCKCHLCYPPCVSVSHAPKLPAVFNDSAKVISVICHFQMQHSRPKVCKNVYTSSQTRYPNNHITRLSIIPGRHHAMGQSGRVSCLPMYNHFSLSLGGASMTSKVCCLLDRWQRPWRRRSKFMERKSETLQQPARDKTEEESNTHNRQDQKELAPYKIKWDEKPRQSGM